MKSKRHTRRPNESSREQSPFFGGETLSHNSGAEFFQPSVVQAKLKVGQTNDPYEKQADGTAHAVVNHSDNADSLNAQSGSVRRKEEAVQKLRIRKQEEEEMQTKLQKQEGEEEEMQAKLQKQEGEEEEVQARLQRQTEAEEEEVQAKLQKQEEEEVQAKSDVYRKEDISVPTIKTESRISQAKGGGQALPDDIRLELEAKLGSSFKKVRIHDDLEAHKLCEELHALAFTTGNHIFFKKGNYQPYTQEGKFLLVHELTHVLQQRNNNF